jgi:hypothetical protein
MGGQLIFHFSTAVRMSSSKGELEAQLRSLLSCAKSKGIRESNEKYEGHSPPVYKGSKAINRSLGVIYSARGRRDDLQEVNAPLYLWWIPITTTTMVSELRHLGEASERLVVFTTSVLYLHLIHFLCPTPCKLTITL